jgi:hypothetical protein
LHDPALSQVARQAGDEPALPPATPLSAPFQGFDSDTQAHRSTFRSDVLQDGDMKVKQFETR